MDMSLSKLLEFVMDKEVLPATVQGVAKSQTWLSYWTELKRGLREPSCPFLHVGTQWEEGCLWIRKWVPIRHQMCWTQILDFPVSRSVSDKCLQHKSPSLRYICYTAWTHWDTFDRGPFLTPPTSVLFASLCTSAFYDLIPWHALESSTLFSPSTPCSSFKTQLRHPSYKFSMTP